MDQRFEHLVIQSVSRGNLERTLKNQECEGWELITLLWFEDSGFDIIFKRPSNFQETIRRFP